MRYFSASPSSSGRSSFHPGSLGKVLAAALQPLGGCEVVPSTGECFDQSNPTSKSNPLDHKLAFPLNKALDSTVYDPSVKVATRELLTLPTNSKVEILQLQNGARVTIMRSENPTPCSYPRCKLRVRAGTSSDPPDRIGLTQLLFELYFQKNNSELRKYRLTPTECWVSGYPSDDFSMDSLVNPPCSRELLEDALDGVCHRQSEWEKKQENAIIRVMSNPKSPNVRQLVEKNALLQLDRFGDKIDDAYEALGAALKNHARRLLSGNRASMTVKHVSVDRDLQIFLRNGVSKLPSGEVKSIDEDSQRRYELEEFQQYRKGKETGRCVRAEETRYYEERGGNREIRFQFVLPKLEAATWEVNRLLESLIIKSRGLEEALSELGVGHIRVKSTDLGFGQSTIAIKCCRVSRTDEKVAAIGATILSYLRMLRDQDIPDSFFQQEADFLRKDFVETSTDLGPDFIESSSHRGVLKYLSMPDSNISARDVVGKMFQFGPEHKRSLQKSLKELTNLDNLNVLIVDRLWGPKTSSTVETEELGPDLVDAWRKVLDADELAFATICKDKDLVPFEPNPFKVQLGTPLVRCEEDQEVEAKLTKVCIPRDGNILHVSHPFGYAKDRPDMSLTFSSKSAFAHQGDWKKIVEDVWLQDDVKLLSDPTHTDLRDLSVFSRRILGSLLIYHVERMTELDHVLFSRVGLRANVHCGWTDCTIRIKSEYPLEGKPRDWNLRVLLERMMQHVVNVKMNAKQAKLYLNMYKYFIRCRDEENHPFMRGWIRCPDKENHPFMRGWDVCPPGQSAQLLKYFTPDVICKYLVNPSHEIKDLFGLCNLRGCLDANVNPDEVRELLEMPSLKSMLNSTVGVDDDSMSRADFNWTKLKEFILNERNLAPYMEVLHKSTKNPSIVGVLTSSPERPYRNGPTIKLQGKSKTALNLLKLYVMSQTPHTNLCMELAQSHEGEGLEFSLSGEEVSSGIVGFNNLLGLIGELLCDKDGKAVGPVMSEGLWQQLKEAELERRNAYSNVYLERILERSLPDNLAEYSLNEFQQDVREMMNNVWLAIVQYELPSSSPNKTPDFMTWYQLKPSFTLQDFNIAVCKNDD